MSYVWFTLFLIAVFFILSFSKKLKDYEKYKQQHTLIENIEKRLENRQTEWNLLVEQAKEDGRKQSESELDIIKNDIKKYTEQLNSLKEDFEKQSLAANKESTKVAKLKEQYKSFAHVIKNYTNTEFEYKHLLLPDCTISDADEMTPSVILKLHCMDIKSLRKAYNDNNKAIDSVLDKYSSKYTTKANAAIYKLMVIALRSELQNVLFNLKYEKLEKSLDLIGSITNKYLGIASDGNQSIAPTLVKFIGEIDYLFTNAVKIEYEYYVKKEQEKAEQAAIREQMRQEAEERKELQRQKEMIEKEERKFIDEIDKVKLQLSESLGDDEKTRALEAKIKELQEKLSQVEDQKEDIINRQNGKAGNVYIISNIGSFGENVFKIGMTRRLDPMDRVKELGDASVPFSFDVHSFIFSEDAVTLEKKLHDTLSEKRLNKINLRKEFFQTNIDELEKLVNEIDPTAEFNTTSLAEEYRQSQYMRERTA